jgi:hypothetical protein
LASVPRLSAQPSRKDAKELPRVNDVAPGTLAPKKLYPAVPEICCSPMPTARCHRATIV